MLSPAVLAIPAQILAYLTAVEKGTDVDQPRNLAKSVTVPNPNYGGDNYKLFIRFNVLPISIISDYRLFIQFNIIIECNDFVCLTPNKEQTECSFDIT